MDVVLITGSAGLIGSEAVEFFGSRGFKPVGIDNDMRRVFFGEEASTRWNAAALREKIPGYDHRTADIRDTDALDALFTEYGRDIKLVIHTAAQPSHDWAAREPVTDFTVNANGTLNLLEMTRRHCPGAVFIFTSTNKVYGDTPNRLPLKERETRWDLEEQHPLFDGIDETMSIDQSQHSLFGASKVAADILVQEYGRYFGLKTGCFRGGCLTGPRHSGAALHGFLSYLMKCCMTGTPYTVLGYKGKQVRDNIHSFDLVHAFYCFFQAPRPGEVYNIGGGRANSCSVLEAIRLCEDICGRALRWDYKDDSRSGDHIWYISSLKKFTTHYPQWEQKFNLRATLSQIWELNQDRWKQGDHA
ncbi:MAG TPA: NAD-dependent epimerase/dehydratase family protein [Candidatus Omnitrophota bacterium]|nr:NAD-dependent epimerase/dehydratase family protein [Candidatus Omnitrophota bacterium]HQO58296.1 NAD-dependent epimerase/dehydratase family protein [Candidatus Omnitrophota bacterium]HQP11332.1 NAD-dependent epimerase/dehydratase family protein [Candidatus Omnitrophota bacterium]